LHETQDQHSFVSFPRGLSLVLQGNGARLYHRMMPFTNLGLSLVGPTSVRKNVYGIAHKKVGLRNDARVVYTKTPAYVRTCHDQNDSQAWHGEEEVTAAQMPEILARFPFLLSYFPYDAKAEEPSPLAA